MKDQKMYETICAKLGFDPFYAPLETRTDFFEDDTEKENPMRVLSEEELDFVIDERITIVKEMMAKNAPSLY
ncbi:hypothetical protein NHG32_07270 [Aerococcaceae bacterium NML191219]|nr:hypothetical protein [Aerococcaceae bacterium NML191219]